MKRLVVAISMVLLAVAEPVRAETDYMEEAGMGMLAVLANFGYMPAKLTYAAVGAMIGGLAYIVSGADLDSASSVWGPSLGGTYVVTSTMIRGDAPIVFAAPSHCHCGAQDQPDKPRAWVEEPLT